MNVPEDHALHMDLQRIEEIFQSARQAVFNARTYEEQIAMSRWCEQQAIRFQRLGSVALQERETA